MQEFNNYIKSLLGEKNLGSYLPRKVSLDTRISDDIIRDIISGKRLPSEGQMYCFIRTYGDNNYGQLREIAERSPKIAFTYWNLLYPEYDNIERIGGMIEKYAKENHIFVTDLAERLNMNISRCRHLLKGRTTMSYEEFLAFSEVLKMEPCEMLNRFKAESRAKERFAVTDFLADERKKAGLSIKNVATMLGVNSQTYSFLENGRALFTKDRAEMLAGIYGVDFETLDGLIKSAGLYEKTENKTIESVLVRLMKYKNVEYNGKRIKSYKFVTAVSLAMFDEISGTSSIDLIAYLKDIFVAGRTHEFNKPNVLADFKIPAVEVADSMGVRVENVKNEGFTDALSAYKFCRYTNIPAYLGIEEYYYRIFEKNSFRKELKYGGVKISLEEFLRSMENEECYVNGHKVDYSEFKKLAVNIFTERRSVITSRVFG